MSSGSGNNHHSFKKGSHSVTTSTNVTLYLAGTHLSGRDLLRNLYHVAGK
jgi:hypothetical protein